MSAFYCDLDDLSFPIFSLFGLLVSIFINLELELEELRSPEGLTTFGSLSQIFVMFYGTIDRVLETVRYFL
jgi:hypothetical protein